MQAECREFLHGAGAVPISVWPNVHSTCSTFCCSSFIEHRLRAPCAQVRIDRISPGVKAPWRKPADAFEVQATAGRVPETTLIIIETMVSYRSHRIKAKQRL
jgi:hypothetical protein